MAATKLALVMAMLLSLKPWIEVSGFEEEVNWAKKVDREIQETITTLQFYFHDTLSGKSPSAVKIAQATDTDTSLTVFGKLLMADDPLTEGPDPTSKLVGRAQGLYGSAGQGELSLIMAMSFGFTDGVYNGSSISVFGRNPALNPVRELPVVSGTGVFRMARGYAIARIRIGLILSPVMLLLGTMLQFITR